jgi:hypothetical protein
MTREELIEAMAELPASEAIRLVDEYLNDKPCGCLHFTHGGCDIVDFAIGTDAEPF